jgi:molybdopterin synthase catalytic subunit
MTKGIGADTVVLTDIVDKAISVTDLERSVSHRLAGAVVSFVGALRDHVHERSVIGDRARVPGSPEPGAVLGQVAQEVCGRHDVVAVAVVHRSGRLAIGEAALGTIVSAGHRTAAFAACADVVDTVRAQVPIWKHQFFANGTDAWVDTPLMRLQNPAETKVILVTLADPTPVTEAQVRGASPTVLSPLP